MRTVLLDRDGVITSYIQDAYLSSVENISYVPGSLDAVRKLAGAGYRIIVISNQAGVGKGLMKKETLDAITEQIVFDTEGRVAEFFYCIHTTQDDCECRKPKPGLILEAARRHGFDLKETWFVGDSASDIEAGRAAGCRTLLVRSGQAWAGGSDADLAAENLHDAITFRGEYDAGDFFGFKFALKTMREKIDALSGRVLIAHHGDCDGIVGGALLAAYLKSRGCDLEYASAAEFRLADLPYFENAARNCDAAVFVEAQGMPREYERLDAKFLNVDHHPHPADTPIRRMLNPRAHEITPNPAIGLVMHELLGGPQWLASAASIIDYCPLPAKHLPRPEPFDEIRDTFLACQYVLPYTTGLAEFLSTLPSPEEFITREPYKTRRQLFRSRLAGGINTARERGPLMIAETESGDMRIASPLANRLSELFPTKCVVVGEVFADNNRLSVRSPRTGSGQYKEINIGHILGEIVKEIGAGDGTGHEKAGSARIPRNHTEDFLRRLEEKIG